MAEKAIRELEGEILHQQPSGGAITQVLLSIATANLNARVRNRGMSARELWTQRDQFTNEQLPLNDYRIIREQHELRNANHEQSRQSKSPRGRGSVHTQQHIDTGDIVYLYSDKSKLRSRCRYLVVSMEGDWLQSQIQDFPKEGAPFVRSAKPTQFSGGGVVAEFFRGLRKPM